jgi:hypothetical protein
MSRDTKGNTRSIACERTETGQLDLLNTGTLAPRERLHRDLDEWSGMDETTWTQVAVDRLKDDILDVFMLYPVETERWFTEWRGAQPGARLTP